MKTIPKKEFDSLFINVAEINKQKKEKSKKEKILKSIKGKLTKEELSYIKFK